MRPGFPLGVGRDGVARGWVDGHLAVHPPTTTPPKKPLFAEGMNMAGGRGTCRQGRERLANFRWPSVFAAADIYLRELKSPVVNWKVVYILRERLDLLKYATQYFTLRTPSPPHPLLVSSPHRKMGGVKRWDLNTDIGLWKIDSSSPPTPPSIFYLFWTLKLWRHSPFLLTYTLKTVFKLLFKWMNFFISIHQYYFFWKFLPSIQFS